MHSEGEMILRCPKPQVRILIEQNGDRWWAFIPDREESFCLMLYPVSEIPAGHALLSYVVTVLVYDYRRQWSQRMKGLKEWLSESLTEER
jgi:hypothetical protein